ncbi:light-regulated signal transduction histidine kinase (bacteriophytochrome) [Pseudoduganella flava]|uniref:histidine kinase n=1 Tax=Pseudoduganella flava TaxID=871742 RepID=A0A562PEN3_9BURK|nr:ATP-binding protein [Pseudoduganella flava]QGZ38830.1 GAF domain-containing protein [Pseudoduganella flava]TWI42894.1 light-regulated signal transduction histidine kinase (bacteriophytochrome) [Pseudoduganella flava]
MNEQPSPQTPASPVGLDNCADEPIHIPGLIQPHGALLAFAPDGALRAWSANVPALLGVTPALGMHYARMALAPGVADVLRECLDGADTPTGIETSIGGQTFDCVVHGNGTRAIAEFELRDVAADELAAFALKAHAAVERLRRQKTIDGLLTNAVEQVRAITGFDRVMAYRFRHDDSGDVVAESRRDDLKPFLGMRYPASDIPAQARRLYTINTLRLIADIGYTAVPVLGAAGDAPLDLSHSVLRSVSPIHVEYLQNMGVAASMSVSIVINGKLWGLIACHHMAPLRVPYSVRMACDVVAQVLAAAVQSIDARERMLLAEQAAGVRTRLIETLLREEDVLAALEQHAPDLAAKLGAHALVFSQQSKLTTHGAIDGELAAEIVACLPADGDEMLHRFRRDQWPAPLRDRLGPWVGLLALHFDPATHGWLLALRREQVETVRWAGKPDKLVKTGPLGHRLTPRGSFDEWVESVHDMAEPWDEPHLLVAEQLLGEMHRASMARHAELEKARMQLLAMLGHDLRDPLQSISMAATVLQHGAQPQQLGQRIERSSGRMQRLISQVLDMSRLDSGMGLALRPVDVDLSKMVEDLLDESRLAHPGTHYEASIAPDVHGRADPDRMAQVISNLLSNARHHGAGGHPVLVSLRAEDGQAVLEVANESAPIPPELEAHLFHPFKRMALQNRANRTGMGLGLYIAENVVKGHGGTVTYRYEAPHVIFRVAFPLQPAS